MYRTDDACDLDWEDTRPNYTPYSLPIDCVKSSCEVDVTLVKVKLLSELLLDLPKVKVHIRCTRIWTQFQTESQSDHLAPRTSVVD